MIDSSRYCFRVNILISWNTVTHCRSELVLKYVPSLVLRLVEDVSSLKLVLPLLVTRWRSLVADVPAMVVDISGIGTSVCCLRNSLGDVAVSEPLPYQEVLSLVGKLSVGIELVRSCDALAPFRLLGSQKVLVNFVLDHSSHYPSLWSHVLVFVEERVLRIVVDLVVPDASYGLGSFIKSTSNAGVSHNV
jgi:hypothetical protein